MTTATLHLLPLYSADGKLQGVYLSPELWEKAQSQILPILQNYLPQEAPVEKPEPLDEWNTFKEYWDFKYPFSAEVQCRACSSQSKDWEHDTDKKFRLKSASFNGLVVFQCLQCNATVRKKHFKDHICYEASPS